MLLHFRTRIQSQAGIISPSFSFLNPLCDQRRSKLSHTLNPSLEMVTEAVSSRRPMCPSCTKPSRLCLCTRIKTPSLNNSVGVTILQHSLERKHPLNSTRIATLGLKNINLVSVSDVNLEAQFIIRSLESGSERGSDGYQSHSKSSDFDQVSDYEGTQNAVFDTIYGSSSVDPEDEKTKSVDTCGEPDFSSEAMLANMVPRGFEGPLITFTVGKYGVIRSHGCQKNPNFDLLLASPEILDTLAKGFVVKKWENKQQLNRSINSEEFEITVPCGSALLFPSETSVGIEAIDFDVKNLIVLDGTWAKAKRMYNENPWLKLLPHLKLDLDKMSLYSEVRHQPRAGCLSTIESIVYALKAVGDDETDGLDNLLEVFQSMVGDQRRCKDERLSKISLE